MPVDVEAYIRGDIPSLSVHPDSPHRQDQAAGGRAQWPFVPTAAAGFKPVYPPFVPPATQHSHLLPRRGSIAERQQRRPDLGRGVVQHAGWSALSGHTPPSPGGVSAGGQPAALFADAVTQHFGGGGAAGFVPMLPAKRTVGIDGARSDDSRTVRTPEANARPWSVRLPESVTAARSPARASFFAATPSMPPISAPRVLQSTSAPTINPNESTFSPAERLPRKPLTLDAHETRHLASPPGPRTPTPRTDVPRAPNTRSEYDRRMPAKVADTSRPGLYRRYSSEVAEKAPPLTGPSNDHEQRASPRLDRSGRSVPTSPLREQVDPSDSIDPITARVAAMGVQRRHMSPSPPSPEMAHTPISRPGSAAPAKMSGEKSKGFSSPVSPTSVHWEGERYDIHPSPNVEFEGPQIPPTPAAGPKRYELPAQRKQYIPPGFPKPTREVAWNREGPAMRTHGVAWLREGEIGEVGLPLAPKGARWDIARPPGSG